MKRRCRLFHCWGPWSEPYDVRMLFTPTNQPYVEHRQRRECGRCGKIEEHTL